MICSVYGVTVVSLIVVTLTNLLEMDSQEHKVFTLLTRLTIRDNIKRKSAEVIGLLGKAGTSTQKEKSAHKLELLNQLNCYVEELKQIKS